MTIEDLTSTKETEGFIKNAIAKDVFEYFYGSIEQYKRYLHYEKQIIDGKKVPYSHTIFELHPPKNNRFELKEIYLKEIRKPGESRHAELTTALVVKALQWEDGVIVTVKYSPFFEKIVKRLLRNCKYDGQTDDAPAAADQSVEQKWEPWLHIKDLNDDRKIIELWCKGTKSKDIATQTFKEVTTINNIISFLRKNVPEARIPYKAELDKQMRFLMK